MPSRPELGRSTSFFDPDVLDNPHEVALARLEAQDRGTSPGTTKANALSRHRDAIRQGGPRPHREGKQTAEGFVFAFDIDGVLVRGGKAIPEAVEAMKVLEGENEWNLVV